MLFLAIAYLLLFLVSFCSGLAKILSGMEAEQVTRLPYIRTINGVTGLVAITLCVIVIVSEVF